MMERLGVSIAQAPHVFGWHALATWARHLPEDSAVYRAAHPQEHAFASAYGRASIAADIFDAVMTVARTVASVGGGRPRAVKPYPRPNGEGVERDHFGEGAISIADFDHWYYEG